MPELDMPYKANPIPVSRYNEAMEWSFRNVETCEYTTDEVDGKVRVLFAFQSHEDLVAFQESFS